MEMSKIIFDTDCLSSFLWTDSISLLKELYGGKLKIPSAVHDEIKKMQRYPKYSYVYQRLKAEIDQGEIGILEIKAGSNEYTVYDKIKKDYASSNNGKQIGEGEAEMLALAIAYKLTCTLSTASNNLRDVTTIAKKEGISNLTTIDILCEAYRKGLRTLAQLDTLKKRWN